MGEPVNNGKVSARVCTAVRAKVFDGHFFSCYNVVIGEIRCH